MPFGSKRKVKVFSDVYNLAGDIHLRPNFLKTLIFGQTMYRSHESMAQALSQGYLGGPGVKLRQLIPSALHRDFYTTVGQSSASITSLGNLDSSLVQAALDFRLGKSTNIYEFKMGAPELYWWGLQYLLEFLPERAEEIFDVSVNEEETSLQIDFYTTPEDEEPYESLEFPSNPSVIDNTADYLFILYGVQTQPGLLEEINEPEEEVEEFPPVDGFGDPVSEVTEDIVFEWEEVVQVRDVYPEYEDTQEFKTPKTETAERITKTYNKITNIPASVSNAQALRVDETYVLVEGHKLVPKVTETVEEYEGFTRYTTVYDYTVEPAKFSSYNKKTFEVYALNDQRVYIHKRGSDSVFDDLFEQAVDRGHFFPVIPIKYDTRPGTKPRPRFISDSSDPLDQELYSKSKIILGKASKRSAYDDLVKSLKENGDADDVNYIYIMYGAPLNSPSFTAKKYIYHFFKTFGDYSPETANAFNSYLDARAAADHSREVWVTWNEAQKNTEDPLFGTPEPYIVPYPRVPIQEISLKSINRLNLNYKISWGHISSETGSGVLEDMSPRSIVIEKTSSVIPAEDLAVSIVDGAFEPVRKENDRVGSIKIKYQIDESNWEILTVTGLLCVNTIHRGKSVSINGHQALDDEDESGFIIPLHEIPFRNLRLVDATQFAASSSYLLLNYYLDIKQKWYQRGAFQVLVIVAIVVITVAFPPGGAAGAATLGAKVASIIGLTGATATVFAAAVNAIAGIIISRLISEAAIAIFGDKIGIIVGAVVSLVAISAMNSYFAGQKVNLLDAFNSVNLLKLGGTLSTELAKHYQQQIEELQKEATKYVEEFERESRKLNKLFSEEFADRALIDPIEFYQRIMESTVVFETPDQFFNRTLMTGSDISSISLDALREVINLENTLQLP